VEWAHKVARKSPLLMRRGKNAIDATRDMSLSLDALEALRAQLALAFTTEDIVEGVAAFRGEARSRVEDALSLPLPGVNGPDIPQTRCVWLGSVR